MREKRENGWEIIENDWGWVMKIISEIIREKENMKKEMVVRICSKTKEGESEINRIENEAWEIIKE